MSDANLIQTLKTQHGELARVLGVFVKSPPSSQEVGDFAKALLAHLDLEDKRFYPELSRRGAVSGAVGAGFQATMKSLAAGAVAFIEKWTKNDPRKAAAEFSKEITAVVTDLSKRIKDEEEKLYPLLLRK